MVRHGQADRGQLRLGRGLLLQIPQMDVHLERPDGDRVFLFHRRTADHLRVEQSLPHRGFQRDRYFYGGGKSREKSFRFTIRSGF